MIPDVTILMPTYNQARYIGDAIQSIREQDHKEWKAIIVNDGSTDDTARILGGLADTRITVVTLPENRGRGFARNVCLGFIDTPFASIFDSDDISLPERLSRQLNYLDKNPHIAVTASQLIYFSDSGSQWHGVQWPEHPADIRRRFLRGRMGVPHASATLRSRLFLNFGQYAEQCLYGQDLEFFLRFYESEQFYTLPEQLVMYRKNESRLSFAQWRLFESWRRYAIAHARAYRNGSEVPDFQEWRLKQQLKPCEATEDLVSFVKSRL